MAKIITHKGKTISANRFLVGKALDAFRTLVTDHNGKIDLGKNGFYKATFDEIETATRVADALNRIYDEHNVRMPEPKKAKGDAQKPSEPKWKADLKALAGKGTKANKDAAAILRKHGLKPLIGEEGWDYWASIR